MQAQVESISPRPKRRQLSFASLAQVMPEVEPEKSVRTQSGLGIGLSVVKDVAALHGGSVQATSNGLGKGSEFTVRLPLPAPQVAEQSRLAASP